MSSTGVVSMNLLKSLKELRREENLCRELVSTVGKFLGQINEDRPYGPRAQFL